ncbi:MAG: hypothetical protein ACT4NY_20240 [Pseudonocardiales bacterium]
MTTPRYDDLSALFINCTLKRSPETSHTAGLIEVSTRIMEKHGIAVAVLATPFHRRPTRAGSAKPDRVRPIWTLGRVGRTTTSPTATPPL